MLQPNARPSPALARTWSTSEDGRVLRISLRPGLKFHDGRVLDAATAVQELQEQLPGSIGPIYEDIAGFEVKSDTDFEIKLNQPSALVLEGLDVQLISPGSPGVGTGPFRIVSTSDSAVEMEANPDYYQGRPILDHISIRLYPSVRSAWADMLRGKIDMLYDVDVEALDSLQSSSAIGVHEFKRRFAYGLFFNVRKPMFKDPAVRRALNMAVDRSDLVAAALHGHGESADSPVWPAHWAFDATAPRFEYKPAESSRYFAAKGLRFTCLTLDSPPYERLALALQRQLHAVGVTMEIEPLPVDKLLGRWQKTGDFEAALAEQVFGAMSDQYRFWHTGGAYNYGGFGSREVDSFLDAIRHSTNDAGYKQAVSGFQRAIVKDPAAVFLAWSARARAVSRRFYVPAEPGDVFLTLNVWRPVSEERAAIRK